MTNVERVTLRRHRKRLGLRPMTVIVSEQEIDYDYELACTENASIGRAVSAVLFGLGFWGHRSTRAWS
jgi:hypothetical protein